jgi:hypothetical protein
VGAWTIWLSRIADASSAPSSPIPNS